MGRRIICCHVEGQGYKISLTHLHFQNLIYGSGSSTSGSASLFVKVLVLVLVKFEVRVLLNK